MQGTCHPLKYLRGLATAIEKRDGQLFAHTGMESVEEHAPGVVVKTLNGRTVKAAAAVIATNSPINDRTAIHTKQAAYRTYAMAFKLPKDALPDALFWDTLHDYHYVRLHAVKKDSYSLIVGGADHKSGEADDGDVRFEALEAWMRHLLPTLKRFPSNLNRWDSQEVKDGRVFVH
jgi:glycine/D-amino acid oxidase-like deaminating enzyme